MKLGLALTETAFSAQPTIDLNRVLLAESLEYDSVWAAEAYGCDAVSSVTWLAAHRLLRAGMASVMINPCDVLVNMWRSFAIFSLGSKLCVMTAITINCH